MLKHLMFKQLNCWYLLFRQSANYLYYRRREVIAGYKYLRKKRSLRQRIQTEDCKREN
jgi:hypothetical protein